MISRDSGNVKDVLKPLYWPLAPATYTRNTNSTCKSNVISKSELPTSGNFKHTLCSVLCKQLNNNNIHPSHRLDKSTHGLVIFYKNIQAANWIGKAFENRAISKTYFHLLFYILINSKALHVDFLLCCKENFEIT